MPTNAPTLLHSVWRDMLPEPERYQQAEIWEATRFCIDETASSRKQSLLNKATLSISLAVSEFSHANGIREIIAISEKHFFNMSGVFGPKAEIISSKREADGTEIHCGIWPVAEIREKLDWTRSFIKMPEPVQVRESA